MQIVKEMLRDRMLNFWFIIFPLMFILILGAIFSDNDKSVSFDVGIVVEDHGKVAQDIKEAFDSVLGF